MWFYSPSLAVGGPATVTGTAALSSSDSLVVSGVRTTFGTAGQSLTDLLVVAGLRTVYGTAGQALTDLLSVAGLRTVLGSVVTGEAIAGYKMDVGAGSNSWLLHATVSASTEYTFSFYAKRGTATDVNLSVFNWSGFTEIIAPESYYSEINGTDWARVERTFTTPGGCTDITVYLSRDSSASGTTFVAAAQVEAGASATSWERTNGSPGSKNLLAEGEDLSAWSTFGGVTVAQDANFQDTGLLAVLTALGETSAFSEVFGAAALAGGGVLTVAGLRSTFGVAALSSPDALVVAGLRSVYGASALAAADSLVVAGTRTVFGTASLSDSDTLTVLAVRTVLGTSGLVVVDALTADGRVVQVITGLSALSSTGTLTVNGQVVHFIEGTALVSLGGLLRVFGDAHLPAIPVRGRSWSYSPRQRTATGFAFPMRTAGGDVIYMVRQYVMQVPYERRAVDRDGVEWRVTDVGLVEPV